MFNALILGFVFYYFYKNQIRTGKIKTFFRTVIPRIIQSLQVMMNSMEGKPSRSTRAPIMSKDEARQVLGLPSTASKEEILQNFKKLMLKVHPDQGGNSYLVNKVIQAKKTLLNE